MADFKGLSDWIEIFRGGKQVDSEGREHDGDTVIDRAVETFNTEKHEPSVVIGHPKDNAPAFAWVEDLKTAVKGGVKVLLAKLKQVVPEFEEMVKQGLFKKRSASFYPDGRLRHVGFLGAAPPAVKGLADIKFGEDDEAVTFDFYDERMGIIAGILRNLRDYFIEKEGKEKADAIIPDWDVEYIREEANKEETQTEAVPAYSGATSAIDNRGGDKKKEDRIMSGFKEKVKGLLSFMGVDISKVPEDALPDSPPDGAEGKTFTEADLDKIKKDAIEEGRKKAETEFTEKEKTKRKEARVKEISTWCEDMVKAGKMAPAWVKYGLPQIMEFLAGNEDVIEFGEGDGKEKATPYDRLKGLFEKEIPKIVEFKELASRDKDVGAGSAGAKLSKITADKMKEDKALEYSAAFAEAQRENPELAEEYAAEMTG